MRKCFNKIPLSLVSVLLVLIIILASCMGFVGGISEGVAKETSLLVKEPIPQKVVREKYVRDEIIVKFKPGVKSEEIEDLNRRYGVSEKYTSPRGKFKILKIPKTNTVPEMVEVYRRNPNVEYAEPNFLRYALMVPNDPYYNYQWHFDDDHTNNPGGATSNPYGGANGGGIRMEPTWDIATGNSNVIVAVLDTGVAYETYKQFEKAPDLANTTFVAGYDFVDNDTHPNDTDGHGTHVTGTIAQSTNNSLGVAGIAFNTAIMPVRVIGPAGGTIDDIADGLYFAANNGAKVINMSFGGTGTSTTEGDALAYAYNKGVTLIAAAGNDGEDGPPSYPAAYDAYCIAVGATRYDETVSYYSTTGSYVDLTAPGGDVKVDQNNDGYGDGVLQQTFGANPKDWGYWFYAGTSMASPHIAGVAALLLAENPTWTPDEVRNCLQSTAEDKGASGWDEQYGWGIVDAYQAVLATTPPTYELTAIALNLQTVSAGTNNWPGVDTKNKPITVSASGSWKVTAMASDDFWNTGNTISLGIGSLKMGVDYGTVNPIPKTGEAVQIASGSAGTGLQPDVHTTLDISWDREDIVDVSMSVTITYTAMPN